MRENDFMHQYRASQERITTSDELKQRTLALIQEDEESSDRNADATAVLLRNSPATPSADGVHTAKASPRRRHARWITAAAACFIALALTFGLVPALNTASTSPEAQFVVKAYAASTNSLIDQTDDGLIVFPFDTHTYDHTYTCDDGFVYTGLTLCAQGEGIQRVQATLSSGELCIYSFEDITCAEDPEKANEVLSWKPTSRGTGYYKDYDLVGFEVLDSDDGYGKIEDDTPIRVSLVKRVGQTADLAVDGQAPLYLGLMFKDIAGEDTRDLDLSSLEGETLTITVQFDNGACQTQVIELHQGVVCDGQISADPDTLEGALPFGSAIGSSPDEGSSFITLYGEVVSTTNEPHPYALENANEHLSEPVQPADLSAFLPSYGSEFVVDEVPESSQVHDVGSSITKDVHLYDSDETVPFTLSNLRATTCTTLPANYDLYRNTEVAAFLGNLEYANACRSITNGYSVDENGNLAEGFAYVVMQLDLTNDSDEAAKISLNELGDLCALSDGATTLSTCGIFAASGWEGCDGDNTWQSLTVDARQTQHIELVFIASDNLLASGDLALVDDSALWTKLYEDPDIVCSDNSEFDLSTAQFAKLNTLS